jgi:hypothetical protein
MDSSSLLQHTQIGKYHCVTIKNSVHNLLLLSPYDQTQTSSQRREQTWVQIVFEIYYIV